MKRVDKVLVPGYSGRGIWIERDSIIRVTDIEGCQVGDLFAFAAADHTEYLCTGRTREVTKRLFPEVGQQFYTNYYHPILTFLRDNSPGIHDALYPACDPALYRLLPDEHDHPSCHQNYLDESEKLGISLGFVPGPVNLFQNSPVKEGGTLHEGPALTKPGDHVELKSEMDLLLILTSCSYDVDPIFIGGVSTPLLIEVFAE